MRVTATLYIDVISSWCFWGEPAWAELKKRYAGQVEFNWKIALMDEAGMPKSRAQIEWYYRRSGMLMRSPFMLNTDWFTPGVSEFLAPNLVAEAARDLGVTDDRVRLALSAAGLRERCPVTELEVAAEVGANAGGLDRARLLDCARSAEIEKRIRASTAEWQAMQVTQRPTIVFDTEIGDRAVFSGFARVAPLATALDSMLEDAVAYAAHEAHFGSPPA